METVMEMYNFAEIEIVGNEHLSETVQKPQAIEYVMDEKRRIFAEMRKITGANEFLRINYAKIFYEQAVFMKDFDDDFAEKIPFSSYFPFYQLMNHNQLRTYFTWRTKVRKGDVDDVSASYAFVYIYELLNNIGVSDPIDGWNRLTAFWRDFREYNEAVDKYMFRWIKDYHVYYGQPKSFKDFVCENNLNSHYPALFEETEADGSFEFLCGISKYDIKGSRFYNEETKKTIKNCCSFVTDKLKQLFSSVDLIFDSFIFQSVDEAHWTPFYDALFYPRLDQADRRIELSSKEIYTCCRNKWTRSSIIIMESNKKLAGYILKQMESALRSALKYKSKLSANLSMLDPATLRRLESAGIQLEKAINEAVLEFYANLNRTVVTVNVAALEKIRRESLDIQEKLIVQEAEAEVEVMPRREEESASGQADDIWTSFSQSLNQMEKDALSVIIKSGDIKQFSNANGVMTEVLIDIINQKAYDSIGDNILEFDENIVVYQEYTEKIMEMVND